MGLGVFWLKTTWIQVVDEKPTLIGRVHFTMSQRVQIPHAGRSGGRSLVPCAFRTCIHRYPRAFRTPGILPGLMGGSPLGNISGVHSRGRASNYLPDGRDLPRKIELSVQRPNGAILINPGRIPGVPGYRIVYPHPPSTCQQLFLVPNPYALPSL